MIKSFLYLAILTVTVVISWVSFSVHHSYTTSTIAPDQSIAITPIPAEFDAETLEKIKTKQVINPDLTETRVASGTAETTTASGSANQATSTPTESESTNSAQIEL